MKPGPEIPIPSTEEIEKTYMEFKKAKCLTASMLPRKEYYPETWEPSLPKPLNKLFNPAFLNLTLEQVKAKIKEDNLLGSLVLTDEHIKEVFDKTKNQSSSTLWFQLRSGRITASKFKAACRTKLEKPSLSLLKEICYPLTTRRFFKAGIYGCEHEQDALNAYLDAHKEEHPDAVVRKSGLILNKKYPFFGASPDGILDCITCGSGCIEVKCPYCVKDTDIEDIVNFKTSCLVADRWRKFQPEKRPQLLLPIQMQMALGCYKFCDFVVWTKHSFFYERIQKDAEFWKEESLKAEHFFEHVVLPELVSKIYTEKAPIQLQPRSLDSACNAGPSGSQMTQAPLQYINTLGTSRSLDTDSTAGPSADPSCSGMTEAPKQCVNTQLWCYCQKPDDGKRMVNCGNPSCVVQWFHRKCLKVKRLPAADWFCSDCTNINKEAKRKKNKPLNLY